MEFHPPHTGTGSELAEYHANELPVAALKELIAFVIEEEEKYFNGRDTTYDEEDDMYEEEKDPFYTSRKVLVSWAEANLKTASDDEHRDFFMMLASLDDSDKIITCGVAMGWVASALEAGDVEKAKRIANALKEESF